MVGALALILLLCGTGEADPVKHSRHQAGGTLVDVVDADLNDPRVVVSPALALGGVGRAESFSSFITRLRPRAAINGTFFGRLSRRPVGDIVVDGELVHFGGMGTAMAFEPGGVDVIRLPKSRRVDWSEHRAALAAGPLLVWDGFAKPRPGGEGFGDPRLFAGAARRAALGVTRDNHLLLVVSVGAVSLGRLAEAMRALGAMYAVNLDGGSSAGLYHDGRVIRAPRRALTNVFCVYVRPEPARSGWLRPPRGRDWRDGHPPRPVAALRAEGLRLSAELPRRWEERATIALSTDSSLPEGWLVRVRIDGKTKAVAGALPAAITLDLGGLGHTAEHEVSIAIADEEGRTVGRLARLFRLGEWSG